MIRNPYKKYVESSKGTKLINKKVLNSMVPKLHKVEIYSKILVRAYKIKKKDHQVLKIRRKKYHLKIYQSNCLL